MPACLSLLVWALAPERAGPFGLLLSPDAEGGDWLCGCWGVKPLSSSTITPEVRRCPCPSGRGARPLSNPPLFSLGTLLPKAGRLCALPDLSPSRWTAPPGDSGERGATGRTLPAPLPFVPRLKPLTERGPCNREPRPLARRRAPPPPPCASGYPTRPSPPGSVRGVQ